ncbi:uncharacterized protein PHACADRAFT_93074 [Phanerochaete carnosa HHB-10118-sp]|uniref:Phosphatase tensin-type domain-containing protein n=1 Tax=Phanerochaete carnosa (strain HHB-10118-sp) TaxID=650164 RepID=K5WD51_PHACS|nr:uncharacterized protein PHACADRAFT_93074 [Phanerochaete carnosa HHB-10118-sp]EKM56934.1 hypothetical protein PHACADRAFT_93074 [Phanerochaete carnosa HHB-10118-sp]
MTDFVRRLVSGKKARFRDEELDLELDLAYITDRIIVMGFPAAGLEGLYRNRREDAKKFLDHRHGANYWIFNFCPIKENSYPSQVFENRVSRYPFPDHHAPPLAILPLIAREMRTWLDGSPERVAVLHCKGNAAGKGRSGTMACTYLLTLTDLPRPPSMGRSRAAEEKAKQRAEDFMNVMPADIDASVDVEPRSDASSTTSDPIKNEISNDVLDAKLTNKTTVSRVASATSLDDVLKLHTAGRMKPPSSSSEKAKQGVSIPSQRRWLYYWSLLIAHQGPHGLWSLNESEREPPPKVHLTQIKIRMHELSGVKANMIKAASTLMDRAGKGKLAGSTSQVWASLARYDDELVDTLEWWERTTRVDDGNMGVRKPGSQHQPDGELTDMFATAKWDKGKMVRPFARLGTVNGDGVQKQLSEVRSLIIAVYVLRPLSDDSWTLVKSGLEGDEQSPTVESEQDSIQDATRSLEDTSGIVLDAHREVRVKLYIGQVFMGWFWFIPTFHMAHPRSQTQQPTVYPLTRKEIDFPLGIGSHLIDVVVSMEWCAPDADVLSPPAREDSQDSVEGRGDPTGIGAAIHAAAIGETQQATEASQVGNE